MFCPVCGEVPLDTPPTVADFLPVAVNYVNEKVRGTLSTSVSVKTNGTKDEQVRSLMYRCIQLYAYTYIYVCVWTDGCMYICIVFFQGSTVNKDTR